MVPELMERIEAEAWTHLQLSPPAAFREQFGIEVRTLGQGVILIGRKTAIPAFNRAVGLGFDLPLDDAQLESIQAIYRDAGVGLFLVQWCPEASPADAGALFARHRLFPAPLSMVKLCRRTSPAPVPEGALRIVSAGIEDADALGHVLVHGHGNAPDMAPAFVSTIGRRGWRHYLALDGERPVAGAALYASGPMAWCGMGATLSTDRGRGAHRALLAQRVRDAALLGCDWITCETMEETADRPNQSFRNMCGAGFEPAYLRTNYVFGAA